MKPFPVTLLRCALTCLLPGVLAAASISLDTVGADPDLTSPHFSFQTDTLGNYNATYRNVSNPPYDFISLELIAPFSQAFYTSPLGPSTVGASCHGGAAFSRCSITFLDNQFTLIFDFSGIDGTHGGIPYNREFGVAATLFEPNQSVSGTATQATAVPEPATILLALAGLSLGGLAVGCKKFLKIRVRA